MSDVQTLRVEIDRDLLSKFDTALSLKNENSNSVLHELISQYIVYAFRSEAFKLNCKKNINIQNNNYNKMSYKSKKNNIGQTDQIRSYISEILSQATEKGLDSLDLISGEIHREMGLLNRMPSVCAAMETLPDFEDYQVIHDTPSKRSSTRIFRYLLK